MNIGSDTEQRQSQLKVTIYHMGRKTLKGSNFCGFRGFLLSTKMNHDIDIIIAQAIKFSQKH